MVWLCYDMSRTLTTEYVMEVKDMYSSTNFKTKKQLKEAVASGQKVTIFAPGLGSPRQNGTEFLEGPHYPAPHTWYAEVTMQDGYIVKVK